MDFNAAEIVMLLLLAIVIFGPEKLPDLARKTARVFRYVQTIANDARGQLRQELGPEFADLKLSDLNPRTMLSKNLLGAELEGELRGVADDLRSVTSATGDLATVPQTSGESPMTESSPPQPVRPATAFDPEST